MQVGDWVIVRSGRYAERLGRVTKADYPRSHAIEVLLEQATAVPSGQAEPVADYPAQRIWFVVSELRPMRSRSEVRNLPPPPRPGQAGRPSQPPRTTAGPSGQAELAPEGPPLIDADRLGPMSYALAQAGLVKVAKGRRR